MNQRPDAPQAFGHQEPVFCAFCGGPLTNGHESGFPACEKCGRVTYLDPKLAGAAMVEIDNQLLLVRRAIQPAYGKWSFPSGYVNRGEQVERAVEREVFEETGLVVATDWLVGLYSEPDKTVVLAVYSATVTGGELIAGDETLETATFQYNGLPELAFPDDSRIVQDWLTGLDNRSGD
ncbi:MAG: NUDIX domain-containing protein [Chloroflexi bacterium]|jgi:8-oxo-dGTP diphosphatase|nr:NUDIX domain-containing protein [Chloroflexota bacterium]MBT4516117.1 NUDIX domain-containing protein [Chloroflexota bacterium]MBT5320611.1 NUDIX domain-containing protein [Chloroflexota bacterium]MBT6681488.1 NUDIX domain-containing protein [Chloroflexota bacterium]